MAIVAVAGGTGNVGRTIVEAILATGKHEVKILSRKTNPDLEAEIGVTILAVDYSDVDAVANVLEDNNIDTVVSGIAMGSHGPIPPPEVDLIRAADLSKATKRMISSDWVVPLREEDAEMLSSIIHKHNAQKELQKTKSLEFTVFYVGCFMDYWGIPGVKSNLARDPPLVSWVDMVHHAAALPGTGDVPVAFTHTTDVAKFVAASLDLSTWEPETWVAGDKVTWNEFVRLAEQATGTKFDITHDSVEKMKMGQVTELPGQVQLYHTIPKPVLQRLSAAFGLWFEEGLFDPKGTKLLNETFPEIKPLTVKEMLNKAWKKA